MKKLFLFLLLVNPSCRAHKISTPTINHEIRHKNSIDDLLDDAQRDGIHQEIIKPRELAWYETWIRTIGGALFIKCLTLRNYVKKIIAFES